MKAFTILNAAFISKSLHVYSLVTTIGVRRQNEGAIMSSAKMNGAKINAAKINGHQ